MIYLNAAEAAELVALLRAQGVLSAERLGDGTVTGLRRVFTVRVSQLEKILSYEANRSVPWLEEIEERLERLGEQHVWQQYFDTDKYASQRAFWEESRVWFDNASPRERSRGLKDLLVTRLLSPRPEGSETFPMLVALYDDIGIPEASDFPGFLQLLAHEALWNARARSLFQLARTSAKAGTDAEARRAGATIEPVRGEELLHEVVSRFGRAAQLATLALLEELGEPRVRKAATDRVAEVRRLSAILLVAGEPEDVSLAMALCDDPEVRVGETAVVSLGLAEVEGARQLFEEKTVTGRPRIRAAAMVALGRLGGAGVGDRALEMLAERDPNLQKAAVEALAELSDPAYASLLAALFSRGPESLLFEPARSGLRRLGPEAFSEVLRLTSSQNPKARRASTLLLAEQGVPEAASLLMTMLTDDRSDLRVLEELSILTCVDFSQADDPVNASWNWWDEVVHSDSMAWLLAEAERQEFGTPAAASLAGKGTEDGARFLLSLVERADYPLDQRATRELSDRLGISIERPRDRALLPAFREDLEEQIAEVYGR